MSHVIVDLAKLCDYCLNPVHPRGRQKARVFALGLTAADAEFLRDRLLLAAREDEATIGAVDGYGERYVLDVELARAPDSWRMDHPPRKPDSADDELLCKY